MTKNMKVPLIYRIYQNAYYLEKHWFVFGNTYVSSLSKVIRVS